MAHRVEKLYSKPGIHILHDNASLLFSNGKILEKVMFGKILKRNFCKQLVQNLIRRRVCPRFAAPDLVLHCLSMSHKKDAMLTRGIFDSERARRSYYQKLYNCVIAQLVDMYSAFVQALTLCTKIKIGSNCEQQTSFDRLFTLKIWGRFKISIGRHTRFWFLSHRRPTMAQTSLCIRLVPPES